MKKIVFVLCLLCSICIYADRENTLKIYNWADYISPEVLESFPEWYKAQTGEQVEIIYNTFDVNENMLTQIEMGKEDYDLICPSEYIIDRMLKLQLLQKIPYHILPDSIDYTKNIATFVKEKFNQMSDTVITCEYAVGYMWGTTGWLYNIDLVDAKDVTSWGAIQNTKYTNNIYMKDAYRDIYSVIVLYVYKDDIEKGLVTREELIQHITQERIDSVQSFLIAVRDNVKGWEVDFGKEEMTKGSAALNLSWSGDAQWAIDEAELNDVQLAYAIPDEGSNVWFDGWCIPIYAKNVKAATYFIDYLCRPDNAIKNMEEIGYVSVIASQEILEWAQDELYSLCDASYFFGNEYNKVHVNPVMYPDKTTIDKCALMRDCGDMIGPMNEMWGKVKGDSLSPEYIILIGIVVTAIIFYLCVRVIKKHQLEEKQNRKKKHKK